MRPCQSFRALPPPPPQPLPFCSIPRDTRLLCACRWLMELPAQWCQDGPEHLQHLTLTWNSKFVCSRNFWFMVSANLLIALRKTLEGETRLLDHSRLPSFSSSQLKFPHPLPGQDWSSDEDTAGQHRGCGCLARPQQLSI